jgi:hypothetical protein
MKIVRHTYLTRCTTVRQPPGFGDYLRGSIGLAILAQEQGFSLKIDLSHHPVGAFLRDKRPPTALPGEVSEFFNERAHLLPEFVAHLRDDASVSLTTNCCPDVGKVTDAVRQLVRTQLSWDESIESRAEEVQRNISEGTFAILHVRVADGRFHAWSAANGSLCRRIERHVLPAWRGRLAVLSNNQAVKKALSERYNLPFVSTDAVHLGECNGLESKIRDTLVDFAIMSRASTIFSYSEYSWDSGFSRWCACLYDVPFISMRRPSDSVVQLAQTICDTASRMMRTLFGRVPMR